MSQRMNNTQNEKIDEKPKKKKSKLMWIIPLIVILLAGAFFAYAFLTSSFMFSTGEAKPVEEKIFSLDEFVLNLNDESGRRYVKTKIVLSYENDKDLNLFDENMAQIRDVIIYTIRMKTSEEMMDVTHTDQLKHDIKDSVNTLIGEPIVLEVYFIDFLIQ